MTKTNKLQIPTGIQIISILYFVASIIGVLLIGFIFLNIIYDYYIIFYVLGIFIGIFGFFSSINLRKAKNWAKKFIIIFSSLNLLFLLASIIGFFIKTNSYIRVFSSIDPFFYPLVVLQSIISFARVWGENVNIWPFLVTIALYCILNLWILWYLIFGKKSKEFFNQS